jgi:hypothetical protein
VTICNVKKLKIRYNENDSKSVDACEDAKQSGRIEDYVFYDASPEYLTSKLKALLPF